MNIERQKPRDEAIEKIENYIIQNHLKPGDRLPSALQLGLEHVR